MKLFNKILIGAGVLAAMSLTSCQDGLTTTSASSFDDKSVFAQYELAQFNVYSIYEVFGHQNCHRARYLAYYGYNTDIEIYIHNGEKFDNKSEILQYDIKSNNAQLNTNNGPYNELMVGIERANLCINGLRQYGNVQNDKNMASLLGESLVARALLYTELLKAFGEVPARFEPITSTTIYLPKTDRDVIYKQLLKDLEESFDYLAWPGKSAATMKTDRPSLAFAKGLYARLGLMASGYALRPDEGMVNTGNMGTVRLSTDPELSKEVLYPKIKTALEDVVKNSGLELYADYEQLWKDFNNFDIEAGKEIIYSIPMGDGRGRWNYHYSIRNENFTSFTGTAKERGGDAGPVPSLYFKYDRNGRDQRRDVSCANFLIRNEGGVDVCAPAGGANWYFGKFRFDWQKDHPYGGGNDDGIKPVYMRYSDILLMLAEVCNELDETNDAKDYLLEVRTRAFRGDADAAAAGLDLSDKGKIFDAIVNERALEFVGEFLRKADLIRWKMLKSKMDEAKLEMKVLSEKTGNIYYKYNEDEFSISFFGLNENELGNKPQGTGWIPYTDSKGKEVENYFATITEERINALYLNDPDTRQWWPIFDNTITNSQGKLKNDYGF